MALQTYSTIILQSSDYSAYPDDFHISAHHCAAGFVSWPFLSEVFLFLTLQSPIANFPTFTSRLDFTVLKSQRMEYYLRESVCDLCQVDENLKSLTFLDLLKIETFSTNLLGFSENVLP